MKKGIVLKLFMLTTALCMLILASIFIGQTIFFKQYYANRKVNDMKTSMKSFEKKYLNSGGNVQAIQKLEQDFYQENNALITILDSNANLKYANDFYVEVKVDNSNEKELDNKLLTIPLYNLISIEDISIKKLPVGVRIYGYGIKKNPTVVPYELGRENSGLLWKNEQISIKAAEILSKENERLNEIYAKEKSSRFLSKAPTVIENNDSPIVFFNGDITKIQIPDRNETSTTIYKNELFMKNIREFQMNLLFNESKNHYDSLQTLDYENNDIKYKLLIAPIKEKDGSTTYIFLMASLQPVDEAVQMVKDYYIYICVFVVLLIFLSSFYYSKQIAKPLLQINNTTKKIASLDFSEKIPITSKDEIGDLSKNINTLSNTLDVHINQLQQDIEKEKQLENTRKEFIAGVSHELKTPLSIMKSCISILKDGVANHKNDYYFEAMEKEVDKMDLMIVDMLELAKFESGTYKMKIDAFYIDQVIEHICEQLSLEMERKQLNVHKKLSKCEVLANQHRIEQVITNFITNAIRYTPEKENIFISTIVGNENVKVCVENKGAYIEQENLDKIWDRFYRGDTSRHRSKGGTGLGLAISKNILDLHGVRYGVSNTDDGVLFFFYLNKNV
ncbi:HAMP domain-containing sensor histidine kinase [Bacillus thuringiensis]|uniref:HAMP domain-containing sensor histidine kinase n=1 Tax=Bacillus thuringiensis TaxID=1428 RepID=UPI0005AF00E6|nr:HAMP domain-containing sensor histidine kinase [Bacillus thuringiensis]KIP28105.1 HAMP domain protein [Bacillus thuringiensis serovar morrisoni]MCT6948012.1 HAMP domain-containing histidine kinase [Bacillus thuringiensis]MED2079896.1 HAMP domain-containing sensor histidine kinase [Bacillus thuringiensis]NUW50732.1 HAMP domain-containing protein [Bacillus thuringiensis]HDR6822742.1 HAMP domain-containing protein [Bacillus thuringiensis]